MKSYIHKQPSWLVILVVALFVSTGQLALFLYLPALPNMSTSLNITSGQVQLSSALFLTAFGFGQLLYGPLSDFYGRKVTLLAGLMILLVAIITLCIYPTPQILMLSRFFQGLGAASVSVLAKAVIFDRFKEDNLNSAYSLLVMITAIIPTISPFLGGNIDKYFGWNGIFIALACYTAVVSLIVIKCLGKSERTQYKGKVLDESLSQFQQIVKNRQFLAFTTITFMTFSCQMAYLNITPFIFQKTLHITTATYGALMLIPTVGYVFGNFMSRKLVRVLTVEITIFIGITLIVTSGIVMTTISDSSSIILNIIPIVIMTVAAGLTFANSICMASQLFPSFVGSAAALIGFIQMIGSSIVNATIGVFNVHSMAGLGAVVTFNGIIMLIAQYKGHRLTISQRTAWSRNVP